MTDAAEHFLAVLAADRNWPFLGGMAVILVALGFWNWRGAVKAALVLLLFEGFLRKQLLPGLQELSYALKDLLLAGAYLRFFLLPDDAVKRSRLGITKRSRWVTWICVIIVSFSALHPNLGSPLVAIFGLALYLFYLPLVVMMPRLYDSAATLKQGLLRYAGLALPVCFVAIYQWWDPAPSLLSYYAAGMEFPPRLLGTFSYVIGFAAFLSLFFALHLGLFCASPPVWARWMLGINLALLITCGLICGSRSAVVQMALWMVLLPGCLMLMSKVRRTRMLGGIGMLVILLVATVFAIAAQDGVNPRIMTYRAGTLIHAARDAPLLGNGIGVTHPRMDSLRRVLRVPKPNPLLPVYDDEMAATYSELGLAGFVAWYLLRITLMVCSFQSARAPGEFRPLHLTFALAQLMSLFTSFVTNPTMGLLVTAAAGLSLGLERKAAVEEHA
ncbi:MAG: hypothetical protein IPK22_09285 [Verrucomicrobiaceae bacterium]|nr:hypothetical protein [Verrucomicrobiaceae bacterium]